jgi:uncharacterized protein (TIGR04255 family)
VLQSHFQNIPPTFFSKNVIMAQIRHLSKAPIREAVIEFHIAPQANISAEALKQWDIPSTYGALSIRNLPDPAFKLNVDFPIGESSTEQAIAGGVWHDSERNVAVQVMRESLTVNKLTPYTDFSSLQHELQDFWKRYQKTFQPEQIQRIGLRYINEITLHKPLQHYIVPELIPQGEFVQQAARSYYRYEIQRTETLGALVQIVVEKSKQQPTRLIIDIDTFSERPYQASDDAVWSESVEQLHSLKNELFFSIITEEYAKECE